MSPNYKNLVKNILKFIVFVIALIAMAITTFVLYSTYKNGWGTRALIQTAVGSNTRLEELEEFQTLILGISDDIDAKLTDTIIVASYNPQIQKVILLSIPRDTFIGKSKLKATAFDKINAVYGQKGEREILKKVNELTGLNIQNYIIIKNTALINLVDEIGGVYFDVPIKMDYDSKPQNLHIHLKPGYQKLNGKQAEGLIRFRKNNNGTTYSSKYGTDDYGRMKTGREFIKEVIKQTLQAKNITKIGGIIDIAKENVISNIDWETAKEYIPYLVELNVEAIETDVISGKSVKLPDDNGLWFFEADKKSIFK